MSSKKFRKLPSYGKPFFMSIEKCPLRNIALKRKNVFIQLAYFKLVQKKAVIFLEDTIVRI